MLWLYMTKVFAGQLGKNVTNKVIFTSVVDKHIAAIT